MKKKYPIEFVFPTKQTIFKIKNNKLIDLYMI